MWRAVAGAIVVMGLAGVVEGRFAMPERVPVERLERNIGAYVKAHPEKAEGYYTLGRVHYLAVALRTGTVGVYGGWGKGAAGALLPKVAPEMFQGNREGSAKEPVTTEEVARHVRGAVENFRAAIGLDPENALYHLSLASVLEATPAEVAVALEGFPPGEVVEWQESPEVTKRIEAEIARLGDADEGVRRAAMGELRKGGAVAVAVLIRHKDAAEPEVRGRIAQAVKGYWEERAIGEYARAYELAIGKDREIRHKPLLGMGDLVSYEAGTRYLALTRKRPKTEAEEATAREMKGGLKELEAKPPGPVTPIIFSVEGGSRLEDLVDEGARVTFDMDGTARGWGWSWVRPGTGVLVWDPAREGRIESGRQLFGNVTFGLFWEDGYRALAALDDDGDGALAGRELEGLGVWYDRDGDGVSRRGEVVPIGEVGVSALSVEATGVEGESPCNPRGLRMRDGRVLATYDWVAVPARGK